MKSTKMLWRISGIIALLSTLLFLGGFIYAVQDIINPKPSDQGVTPLPTQQSNNNVINKDQIHIVALGDSLSKGTGDLSGDGGYVGKVKNKLKAQLNKEVFVRNDAVNGYREDDLLNYLNGASIPTTLQPADIILLTIGANDLNQVAPNPADEAKKTEVPEKNYSDIRKNLPAAEEKLAKIFAKIAAINPTAKIVYVGLYQPYIDTDAKKDGAALVQEWNMKASSIANNYPNMVVVPTYDLFQFENKRYLYIDEFHPNQLGYDRIADRVVQALQ
jgi:lysophospholipase L1-like esterase